MLRLTVQRQLSGTVNQAMRLRVRVLDANDNGVSDVRVAFRVLAPGRGTFSGGRGNGRGVTDETDRNGYASANFTPSDDGDIIVRASAAGVRDPVTFIIAVGEAADDDDTEPPTPSEDAAPSRDISPVVHVGAASRPPMLWVDGGAIYALVGASAQKFAPSVDNALNITIGGGKVYWTEKTGESGGTINSANLDGSQMLRNLLQSWLSRWGSPLTLRGANSIGRTPVVGSRVRTSTVPVSQTSCKTCRVRWISP